MQNRDFGSPTECVCVRNWEEGLLLKLSNLHVQSSNDMRKRSDCVEFKRVGRMRPWPILKVLSWNSPSVTETNN
jgi:hypothetical protein